MPPSALPEVTTLPTKSRANSAPEDFASQAIRVLCVDDHALLVEGLKAQFSIEGKIDVVGQLATAALLVEEVGRVRAHVVLMDIEMPGPDAFEMADRCKRAHPEVRVIVLSAHIRDAFISASFAAGACAYLSKADDLMEIEQTIHQVMRGRSATFVLGRKIRERCRPSLANMHDGERFGRILDDISVVRPGAPATLLASLTPREAEVLRLIGKGLTRTQIAAQLCRSAKTIDGHQDRIMKKLGIPMRADLMRFAIREGLAQA